MAAVLDRPDALGVQRAPPVQQPAVPGRGGAHGLAASQLTRERVYRGGGVGRLVWVRGDHDHVLRPFVGMSPDDRTAGGRTSVGAKPRSYQVTPVILGRWRATERVLVRPSGRQRAYGSARHRPRTNPSGRTPPPGGPDVDTEANLSPVPERVARLL